MADDGTELLKDLQELLTDSQKELLKDSVKEYLIELCQDLIEIFDRHW